VLSAFCFDSEKYDLAGKVLESPKSTAAENRLNTRRDPHTSFAVASAVGREVV
jgi:hypothetical protein